MEDFFLVCVVTSVHIGFHCNTIITKAQKTYACLWINPVCSEQSKLTLNSHVAILKYQIKYILN